MIGFSNPLRENKHSKYRKKDDIDNCTKEGDQDRKTEDEDDRTEEEDEDWARGYFVLSNRTFTKVYPNESKQQMPEDMSLNDFCNNIEITEKKIVIGSQSSTGGTLYY